MVLARRADQDFGVRNEAQHEGISYKSWDFKYAVDGDMVVRPPALLQSMLCVDI